MAMMIINTNCFGDQQKQREENHKDIPYTLFFAKCLNWLEIKKSN